MLTDVIEKRLSANMPLPGVPDSQSDYSGKLNLRIGKGLHAMLAQRAQLESISMNTLIIQYISYGLGMKEGASQTQQIYNIHFSPEQSAMDLLERYRQSSYAG